MVLFFSCASPEKLIYFQDGGASDSVIFSSQKLMAGDILSVSVTALDMDAVRPFNLGSDLTTSTATSSPGTPSGVGYLIHDDGTIDFPVLGNINLLGKSTQEASDFIEDQLAPYVLDPIVNIRITNFRVTVLGEVANPGTFQVAGENITLPQALGLAGDLTIFGQRNDVLLIRNDGEKREEFRVDLTNKEFMSTPAYYLSQNDIIYVTPNRPRMNSSAISPSTSLIIAFVSLALTAILVIDRL